MKILINDLFQYSDLPDDLKTPGLADRYPNSGTLPVSFTIPDSYSAFQSFDGILSQPAYKTYDDPAITSLISEGIVEDSLFDTATYIPTDDGAGIYPAYENLLRYNFSQTNISIMAETEGYFTINIPSVGDVARFDMSNAYLEENK